MRLGLSLTLYIRSPLCLIKARSTKYVVVVTLSLIGGVSSSDVSQASTLTLESCDSLECRRAHVLWGVLFLIQESKPLMLLSSDNEGNCKPLLVVKIELHVVPSSKSCFAGTI